MHFYRNLILAALVLTFFVVSLGAYVRLSDAGLGCPDWPGCYGKLTPHHAADAINAELAERPDGPVSHAKAWKEMVHRYAAGTLGLLVLAIAVLSWQGQRRRPAAPACPRCCWV
jgi:heme a synthase